MYRKWFWPANRHDAINRPALPVPQTPYRFARGREGMQMDSLIAKLVALALIVVGTIIYFMGAKKRERTALTVPLVSNHGKIMAGGTLVFAGLCVGALILLHG
jgi:hypothetical protein